MSKAFSEMTLEELWALFPITLSPPDSRWAEWYAEEAERLSALLSGRSPAIHHIGSTAVPRIWAKPIVDVLIEFPGDVSLAESRDILTANGYLCMSGTEDRISLNKGYTPRGFARRVFHIHLRRAGDHDELYFRDYLNEHPGIADAYERLKRSLWKTYEHDRDGYTGAKGAFVEKYTRAARAAYGSRYGSPDAPPAERDTEEERG